MSGFSVVESLQEIPVSLSAPLRRAMLGPQNQIVQGALPSNVLASSWLRLYSLFLDLIVGGNCSFICRIGWSLDGPEKFPALSVCHLLAYDARSALDIGRSKVCQRSK
jgi:hypothetical protein